MIDPDGKSPIKGLKALYNVGKKAYQVYKTTGKLNVGTIGKALKSEALDIVDNVKTLGDDEASSVDKVIAVVDLVTGFGDEAKKFGKSFGVIEDFAKRAPKKGKRATEKTDATQHLDEILTAKEKAKKERPSISSGEWEGAKKRPKQHKIENTDKSEQREDYRNRRL